ncbi:MAG: LysR family transcriptional regulator [Desulfobacteraceae bacterium]|nr:LysR family transcriptional regulator [Desulfobacteraceae bacterium]
MLPDLNRIKVFYYIYTHESTIKAAEKLYITQPAVSQQLRKLESEIKVPLFTRLHKKIIPTAAGHKLYAAVKPFIENLECEVQTISTPMDRPYGLLRIGTPTVFGTKYLPRICHNFRKQYQDVRFSIKFEESDVLLDLLHKGDLDFALIDYFSPHDQLCGRPELYRIEPLIEENLILACSNRYFEGKIKNDLSYDHLVKMDFLTDENEPIILKHWFWLYFQKPVSNLSMVMAIEGHHALMSCIKQGMGLGITSLHLFAKEIENGSIIPIFPTQSKLINNVSLVSLQAKVETITEKKFQDYLKKQFNKS